MGRKKIWKNPVRINFQIEEVNYEALLEDMKSDECSSLQDYLNKILKKVIGEARWFR